MVDFLVLGSNQANLQAITPALQTPVSLELTTGQQISAVVRFAADDMVLLDFGGKTLIARTETPLMPQQNVTLEVAELSSSRVWLRVVDSPTAPAGSAAPQTAEALSSAPLTTETKLENLLNSWGLAADRINMDIAGALLSLHQSITAEDVLSLRSQWLTLSPHQAPDLEALVFLNDRQIPVGEESMAAAQNWLDGPPAIAQKLFDLQYQITDIRLKLNSLSGNPESLAKLSEALENSSNQIAGWLIALDKPAPDIAARLATITTNLGNPPEKEIKALLTLIAAVDTPEGISVPDQDEQTAVVARLLQATEEFLIPGKTPEMTETTAFSEAARQKLTSSNPLNNLSSALNEALNTPGLGWPAKEILHHLLEQVQTVTNDLNAVHLANLNTRAIPGAEPFLVFPIPLAGKDSPQTAYLQVYHEPGKQKPNPENMRLALLLDLPDLGEIVFDLSVFKHRLNGKVISGRSETNDLVELELDSLRQRLNATGFGVDSLVCALLEEEPPAASNPARFRQESSVDVSI